MTIEINGKEYPLYFGFEFIEELNTIYQFEMHGMAMKMAGFQQLQAALAAKEITAIKNVIKAGTSTLKSKPSTKDINQYVMDRVVQDGGVDEVFAEFEEALKKQPFLQALANSQDGTTEQAD